MSDRPIRWAVVGTGVVSASFSKALSRVAGHQRQVVVSRELHSAQRFAVQHGFTTALSLEPGVFERDDIDVVYIAAPTDRHLDLCLSAIAARKAVLCEKPMTNSAVQLQTVQRAAMAAGVFAMEGMWLRFNPLVQQLQARLKARECGELAAVSMHIGYAQASTTKSVIDPSCDALSVFGCYGLSLALLLFGSPMRVLAYGKWHRENGAVDHAHVVLDYGNFSFTMETSIVADTRNALEILGSDGRLAIPASVIDPFRLDFQLWGMGGPGKLRQRLHRVAHAFGDQIANWHPLRGSGFREEIAEVGRCLQAGTLESTVNPVSATLVSQSLEQAARQSLIEGKWQDLSV